MKHIFFWGLFSMFFSVNLFGFNNSMLRNAGKNTEPATTVDGYSQLEMPIIIITTAAGDTIDSKENYIDAKMSVVNNQGIYEMADSSILVRLRGNATLYADKKSYKVKFDEKQNILEVGDGSAKTWCLISNCYDGSLLRNFSAYKLADLLDGLPFSPNCLSVELFINNEYVGVYLLCEDINVNKSRVAITENPDEIEDNGYLIEMSRYDEENRFSVDMQSFTIKSELSQTESIKQQQIEYISDYLTKCIKALKSGNRTEAEQFMDLSSLVDIYILNEIVKNVDVGWSSFFSFKDTGEKLVFGPPWDFDLAIGNANCVKGFDSWSGINPYHVLNVNANSNPWFCYALENEWFRDKVQQRWSVLIDKISTLPQIVTSEAESNYQSYCRNFEKWNNILGNQVYIEPEQIVALNSYKEHYTYLSTWLEKRLTWLTDYYQSDDFLNGTFPDDSGNTLSAAINLVEVSSILALSNSENVLMTYEMLPTQGVTMAIENGGVETWEAQIAVTGIMFEKGAVYELSFDYKCSADLPFVFDIQQNYDPWYSYFSGQVDCSEEFQHYQDTFTVSSNDYNCALAFSVGGESFNGTKVTIDNMSIVQKKSSKVLKPAALKNTHLLQTFCFDSKRKMIRLGLNGAAHINLRLYSPLGREVFRVAEQKSAGEHIYPLKTIGLAPGIYIGKIKTGSQTMQRKIIIEK